MISLPAVHGRVYFPPCSPTTLIVSANTFYAHPFTPPRAAGFDQLGLRVTSGGGAGAAVRFAIYRDADGRPGALLNQFAPVVDLIAPGGAAAAVNPPLELSMAGMLWLACLFSEAEVTMPTVAAISTAPRIGATLGVGSLDELPGDDGGLAVGVRAAMVYGEFPEMAPEVVPVGGDAVPLIGLRAA